MALSSCRDTENRDPFPAPLEQNFAVVYILASYPGHLGLGMRLVSLGTRPSHAEEEEGLVNMHTFKLEVRGISAE